MPTVLSDAFVAELDQYVTAGDYTKFYEALHTAGSNIAALYIPGPTGQGIFGQLSHEITADALGYEAFEERRPQVSEAIARGLLDQIELTLNIAYGAFPGIICLAISCLNLVGHNRRPSLATGMEKPKTRKILSIF